MKREDDQKWMFMFNLAKAYYDKYKNSDISYYFRTINGYDYEFKGKKLGVWLHHQKYLHSINSLDYYRTLKLDELRISWNLNEDLWDYMYNYAFKYFEKHGNSNIPYDFVTTNGYERDINGNIFLGLWIKEQKTVWRSLPLDKKNKLSLILFKREYNGEANVKVNYKYARSYNEYMQNEIFSVENIDKKKMELSSAFNTYLSDLENVDTIPDKDEISTGFVRYLGYKKANR